MQIIKTNLMTVSNQQSPKRHVSFERKTGDAMLVKALRYDAARFGRKVMDLQKQLADAKGLNIRLRLKLAFTKIEYNNLIGDIESAEAVYRARFQQH